MANAAFGWPVFSDAGVTYTPTLSGGAWSSDLPLTNLQDRRLAKVARSDDATAASTQFIIDLKVARAVGVLGLFGHNISAAATVQWLGGTTSGGSEVYAGSAVAVSYSAYSAEDLDGYTPAIILVPASAQTARYWTCKVVDTTNADGYVEIGRATVCGIYQPAINILVGAGAGLDTQTERKDTDGGADIFQAKAIRRSWNIILDDISESEAMTKAWRMQRLLGKHGQCVFLFDSADSYQHERAILATLEELGGLDYPYAVARNRTALRIREAL